jgi:hypothetical protein
MLTAQPLPIMTSQLFALTNPNLATLRKAFTKHHLTSHDLAAAELTIDLQRLCTSLLRLALLYTCQA